MNGSTLAIVLMILGAPYQDFNREKAALLVTSADVSQVNHGYIEAYYPEALFYHHKMHRVEKRGETSSYGFLSLSEKDYKSTSMPASFSIRQQSSDSSPDDLNYSIALEELSKLLRGAIPATFKIISDGKPVETAIIPTRSDLKDTDLSFQLLQQTFVPDPAATTDTQQKGETKEAAPKGTYVFHSPERSVRLEIGNRASIKAKYDALFKGTQGDRQAGKDLYAQHFSSAALVFHIYPTEPVGEDETAGNKRAEVKGWHIISSKSLSSGRIVLPVIQPAATKETQDTQASGIKKALSLPAAVVRKDDKGTVTGFDMDATDFINAIFLPTTKPGVAVDSTSFECLTSDSRPQESICKKIKLNDTESRYCLRVEFTPEQSKDQPANTFYLWNPNTADDIYRVTVSIDPVPYEPSSRTVAPVQVRTRTTQEDLR